MIPLYSPDIGASELAAIEDVIDSGQVADGPEVREFEAEFAEFCGTSAAVATSNGTTALHAGMEALGIGSGDYVVTTPLSFVSSANAIQFTGAEPLFADIDPKTYNLDPAAVEQLFTEYGDDIAGVVAVHLYGLSADLAPIAALCDAYDAALVEDAAQAHGAVYDGERVGSIGDIGCFSFYPTKNMTTSEGGMIVTDDESVADRAASFVNHGRDDSGQHATLGHNFRMTSIEAAIGRRQLEKLPTYIEQRRTNAAQLTEGLRNSVVDPPTEPDGRRHAYHQYTVRTDCREALRSFLSERDVQSGIYYPTCIHQESAYAEFDVSAPVAERATEEVVSLPVHPELSSDDLKYVVDTIHAYDE